MWIEQQTTENTIVSVAVKFMSDSVSRLRKVTGVLKTCSENYAVPSGGRLRNVYVRYTHQVFKCLHSL